MSYYMIIFPWSTSISSTILITTINVMLWKKGREGKTSATQERTTINQTAEAEGRCRERMRLAK
jgi:hypothetical protein